MVSFLYLRNEVWRKMSVSRRKNLSLSKLQSPLTTQWLHLNYELCEGVSLPRSSLYVHYLDFCASSNVVAVSAASFGKIIRHTFPDLKTRRLGNRGKSKYHYYGIGVKKTSVYYAVSVKEEKSDAQTSTVEEELLPPAKLSVAEKEKTSKAPAEIESETMLLSSAALLPNFPTYHSVDIFDQPTLEKVKTFLIMYRAHCQRILDTVLRANFSEVQNFLVHFWQGMPGHIAVILTIKQVTDLIKSCDYILYKAISGVLIPSSLQPLPTSLTQAIQEFGKQLPIWLEVALFHLPNSLKMKKIAAARSLSQSLFRQTSLSHLAQASRTVLHNTEHVSQMMRDMREIKREDVCKHTIFVSYGSEERDMALVDKFFGEFDTLFEQQSSIEEYTEWISSVVERCILKPSETSDVCFQALAQEFLLKWSYVTSKFIQELTLKSAKSFGSFHLVQMFFDDYIFYLIESHTEIHHTQYHAKQNENMFQRAHHTNPSPEYDNPCGDFFAQFSSNFNQSQAASTKIEDSVREILYQVGHQQEEEICDDLKMAQQLQEQTKIILEYEGQQCDDKYGFYGNTNSEITFPSQQFYYK